jgi:hypothetical protein
MKFIATLISLPMFPIGILLGVVWFLVQTIYLAAQATTDHLYAQRRKFINGL